MNNRATGTSSYQTNALQFTVDEGLDGTERNPLFSRDEGSPAYRQPGAAQLYNFRLSSLGILDLSLVPTATTMGIRFVKWLWIQGAAELVAGESATIELVDATNIDKVMRLVAAVGPGPGTPQVYLTEGVRVVQGAALRFRGFRAGINDPLRLRVGVITAQDNLHWAAQMQAFCCSKSLSPGGFIPPLA